MYELKANTNIYTKVERLKYGNTFFILEKLCEGFETLGKSSAEPRLSRMSGFSGVHCWIPKRLRPVRAVPLIVKVLTPSIRQTFPSNADVCGKSTGIKQLHVENVPVLISKAASYLVNSAETAK